MKVMPELNVDLCDGCGLCIIACHGGAIVPEDDRVHIELSEDCDFCGVCEAVCPRHAITCFYLIVPA